MLSKFYITGDCHGVFTRFHNLPKEENVGVIILGDFSINFYLNKTDSRKKKELYANYPYITFYCVRGNHEARPQDLPNIEKIFDENVHGTVYYESEYPNIRYFMDYGFYKIKDYLCFVIGGAYSVDKNWRLFRAGCIDEKGNPDETKNNPKKTGWFAEEQLTQSEMTDCLDTLRYWNHMEDPSIDFILTHTCPKKFQPVDMFLNGVDQSKVDDSMEVFLDEVSNSVKWTNWLFGHYHNDRIEQPHVEMFYNDIEDIDDIYNRWKEYDETGKLPWYLVKGPNFDNT